MPIQRHTGGLLGEGNAVIVGLPKSFDLRRELTRAVEIRLATAFAHWSGWRLLRPAIENTEAGVKLLTGLSFCQTEPKVLMDWWNLSQRARISARLFVDKRLTFHPKVLIVNTPKRKFAVIGSGNLSAGGLIHNIECGHFVDGDEALQSVTEWFDDLFDSDGHTKALREPDIRRYRSRFEDAKRANERIRNLQEEAEKDIGDRHRAGLGRWQQAVARAKRFFSSKRFKDNYLEERAHIGEEIKSALNYPSFDFDRNGFEQFYKILALGHLIEITKPGVWRQRKKLQSALRCLVDDRQPVELRLQSVLEPGGRLKVAGAGLNFISKVLAVHAPDEFTVYNAPIAKALGHFEYEVPRGYSTSQKYLEFCRLMKRFLAESGARSTLDLDAFFYDYWERFIKPEEDAKK